MAQLAIKGHATRGSEVIACLEMLGGKIRCDRLGGNELFSWYYINGNGCIDYKHYSLFDNTTVFTLEEFLEKFPYKVGDKVMTDDGDKANIVGMVWDDDIDDVFYETRICNEVFKFPKEFLQPYKEETMEDKSNLLQQLKDYFDNTPREVIEKEWHEYDKYNEISPKVNEYLEYVNNIRQPKYPKTYEECCRIVNADPYIRLKYDLSDGQKYSYDVDNLQHYENIRKLLIYRDAYWKIAGEQMGLGEPWKPDWLNVKQDKYVLFTHDNTICSNCYVLGHNILAFPTEEIRDAFYENFKELIETCKELL